MSNPSLKLEDFSDRELLHALEDHADDDGMVTSHELAEGLGLEASSSGFKHPHQNVAIRLSWLKRYGVVFRDEQTHRWGLTDIGARLMHTGLRAPARRALAEMNEDALFAVAEVVGRRVVGADDEAATMVGRQWRYNLAERKRRARNGRVR